jgi:lysophospholipase L1-like esterase
MNILNPRIFPTLRTTPVRCATFGDSTASVGAGGHDNGIFDAAFPASGATTINYELAKWTVHGFYPQAKMIANGGIPGETTPFMVTRDAASYTTTRKAIIDILNLSPNVVFLRCGSINDLLVITPASYDATIAQCYNNHVRIISRFRAAGVALIDVGIFGYSGTAASYPDLVRSALITINNMLEAYFASLNDTSCIFIRHGLHDAAGFFIPAACDDIGVHLNIYGARLLGEIEAKALERLFGPSAGTRFPGTNLITNAVMGLTSSVGYGIAPNGYTATGGNATLANGKIEDIDGKTYWTVEVTPTTTAPYVTLAIPFTPASYGIVANDLLGFEMDVLATNIAGTGAPPETVGLYVRNDIYKTGAGRFIPSEALSIFGTLPGKYKAHTSFVYRCQEASAALSASSTALFYYATNSLTPFKVGIAHPRLVKLGVNTTLTS